MRSSTFDIMSVLRCGLRCLVLAAVTLAVPATGSQASVKSCPAFEIGSLRATDVTRTSLITCRKARQLLRGAYGRGAIKTVYQKDDQGRPIGRATFWLRGGWRCGNGAGGAICYHATKRRYNEVEGGGRFGAAVTATTG